MQPDSTTLQQLGQLPALAMEALLQSDQVKVVSENTVVAAVTYWLEQEGRREALTAEQLQRLASKLRLCQCTHWYLTAQLMDTEGWLYGALTYKQRIVLLACVDRPETWASFKKADDVGSAELVFGCAVPPQEVHWWKRARERSDRTGRTFSVTPNDIWDAERKILRLKRDFTNGLFFDLSASFNSDAKGAAESNPQARYSLHVNIQHVGQRPPVTYSAFAKLHHRLTPGRGVPRGVKVHDPRGTSSSSVMVAIGCKAGSLPDAIALLSDYIHTDDKLHITLTVNVL